MAVRNIVKIDEDKCNGCGDCVTSCAEGAIEIIDGKAKLVSEIYCDGLGACLGHCPMDAITIEQRDADEFDEKATEEYLAAKKEKAKPQAKAQVSAGGGCACPGSMAMKFKTNTQAEITEGEQGPAASQLGQWPVQLNLVSPSAPYFAGADLLLVADCVPFAMVDFHSRLIQGKPIAIGCPKLDDMQFYIDKMADIIRANDLASLTVIHMQVPCCSGMTHIAKEAIKLSGVDLSFEDLTIGLQGEFVNSKNISS